MRAGGDISVKKPGWPDGPLPEDSGRPSADVDLDFLRGGQDSFFKGPPQPDQRTILEKFSGFFGDLAQKLFPGFFSIFGRVRMLPEQYQGYAYLAFDSGAQLFYNIEGEEIILAGSLYDLASFTHKLLSDPEGWSMGAIVDVIRKQGIPFGSRVIRIGPSSYDNSTGLHKISIRADSGVSFDSFHIRFHEVADLLNEMKEYEIEEFAAGLKVSDIVAALQKSLRGVRPRYAGDVEMMLPMEADNSRFGSENIQRVDAGVRLGPDGKITAVTLRIKEGEAIAERFGAPFIFENESLWIGRINGRIISWEIENSDPQNVSMGRQTAIFGHISRLFRTNVAHVLKESRKANGSSNSGGNTPSVGGGGAVGASQDASAEITGADETDGGIDETANFNAGYEDAGTFETSFGVYMDWTIPDFAPVY